MTDRDQNRYVKFQGEWCVASYSASIQPGDEVIVAKRDGSTKRETIRAYAGHISGHQWQTADEFAYFIEPRQREDRPAPATRAIGDLSGIMAIFDRALAYNRARKRMRSPAIVLGVPGMAETIRINVAGANARVPGSLNVQGEIDEDASFGDYNRPWYGRVHRDGRYEPSRQADPATAAAIERRLREFAANPVRVAGEHAQATGRCCFCNTPIDHEHSTAVGYGPICAEKFGLPWGEAEAVIPAAPGADKPRRRAKAAPAVRAPQSWAIPAGDTAAAVAEAERAADRANARREADRERASLIDLAKRFG